jgi:hypothetical protein
MPFHHPFKEDNPSKAISCLEHIKSRAKNVGWKSVTDGETLLERAITTQPN